MLFNYLFKGLLANFAINDLRHFIFLVVEYSGYCRLANGQVEVYTRRDFAVYIDKQRSGWLLGALRQFSRRGVV